jgi:hypothetical protein
MDDASAIQTLLEADGKGEREPLRSADGDSKAEANEILKTMKEIGSDITEVSSSFFNANTPFLECGVFVPSLSFNLI